MLTSSFCIQYTFANTKFKGLRNTFEKINVKFNWL